jgi:putative IMPACT (imprinted ancient) family translation regulator
MNRDDIIRMAKESGNGDLWWYGERALERFFAAAYAAGAAAERKRLREEIHSCHANCDHPVCVAVRKEREECAELCDYLDDDLPDGLAGWQYGNAIRARGQE